MTPNEEEEKIDGDSPPAALPKRLNFLDLDGEGPSQFFEMARSMSAPPAEFLSSIQNVKMVYFKTHCLFNLILYYFFS